MMKRIAALALLLAASPDLAQALGPHELLVLVNRQSPASIEIAHEYLRLRQVPVQNIVYLDLPAQVRMPGAAISLADFTRLVWEPARQEMRTRRIEDHILAWAYSADFPVRIATDPPMSLHGITFTRNEPVTGDAIKAGQFRSLLYCGPDKEDGPYVPSRSLDQYAALLRQNMPLPSMMLGYTGAHGLSTVRSITALKYGAISDGSAPEGNIYLVKGTDVRATTRAWQFEAARAEIASNRVKCLIVDAPPAGEKQLMGLLMGQATAQPRNYGAYLPGAVADNLTSFGAAFEHADQTKLGSWLEAGATAAGGTVTEPFAIWTKFPGARLFSHYTAGNTILESYYQSIRCPLQILLVGDPLARPWGKAPPITLINLSEDREVKGLAEFFVTGFGFPPGEPPDFLFLMDGRSLQAPARLNRIRFDSSKIPDGFHELRCIAYLPGMIRHQSFSTASFVVNNRGRVVHVDGLAPNHHMTLGEAATLAAHGAEGVTNLALMANGRTIQAAATGPEASFTFTGADCGPGPVALQVEASYPGGEVVRSSPLPITVVQPALSRTPLPLTSSAREDGSTAWIPEAAASNQAARWYLDLMDRAQDPLWENAEALNGKFKRADGQIVLTSDSDGGGCKILLDLPPLEEVKEIECQVQAPVTTRTPAAGGAAIIYHYEDADHFRCFGLFGENSALAFYEKSGGPLRQVVALGASLEPKSWKTLALRQDEKGLSGYLDGELMITLPGASLSGARLGLFAGYGSATFRRLSISPPVSAGDRYRLEGQILVGEAKNPSDAGVHAYAIPARDQ